MSRNISFATFNLYNLQLPGKEWRSKTYSQDEYDAKVDWSAEILRRIDTDVIGFQELWSKECLEDVFDRAGLKNGYTLHFLRDTGWYDIAVAAAVRDPWEVRETRLHKMFPEGFVLKKRGGEKDPEDDEIDVVIRKFSRTVIDLELGHKDHPDLPGIRVLCAHLKSKLPTRLDWEERQIEAVRPNSTGLGAALSTIRRTAEAAALRCIINEIVKKTDTPLVILGDLNDGHQSNTLSIISEQPSFKLFEASRSGQKSDAGLYAASRLQEYRSVRDVHYTHEHKGVLETLDHVMVSEQFYDHSRNRIWSFERMRIWNDHVEDDNKATSDHGVVAAYFRYDPD